LGFDWGMISPPKVVVYSFWVEESSRPYGRNLNAFLFDALICKRNGDVHGSSYVGSAHSELCATNPQPIPSAQLDCPSSPQGLPQAGSTP